MTAIFLLFLFLIYKHNAKELEQKNQRILNLALFQSNITLYLKTNWEIIKINLLILHLRIKRTLLFISNALILYIFLFAALIVFVSHTAYQLGGFGKNLAQFDTDFVTVEYNLNGQVKNVEGIRVYQDKNYIVIRDNENNIHNIFTDQIHIQTKQLQSN